MPTITREFRLYLNAEFMTPLRFCANQSDSGEIWIFEIYSTDSVQYIPLSASLIGTKPDGTLIAVPTTISDGKVYVTETQELTAAAGVGIFELHLDNNHGTANFLIDFEVSPTANGVASESDLTLIQQAIDAADRVAQYGSPLQASSASQMTNHQSVYVYTGTTTSTLTNGHWYYWNGSAWTDGGVYNAVAVTTDKTLTLVNVAADAKAVGDAIVAFNDKFITSAEIEEVLTG